MSISSLTAVAVARNGGPPTKSDAGEVLDSSAERDEKASLSQLLVKQVPTGMVAAYTALTAATVELIDDPTEAAPKPDLLLGYRWAGLGALILISVILTYLSYRSKAAKKARPPIAEMLGVGIAAAGWGVVVPDSPLLAMQDGDRGTALVLLIAFVSVGLNLIVAARLQQEVK